MNVTRNTATGTRVQMRDDATFTGTFEGWDTDGDAIVRWDGYVDRDHVNAGHVETEQDETHMNNGTVQNPDNEIFVPFCELTMPHGTQITTDEPIYFPSKDAAELYIDAVMVPQLTDMDLRLDMTYEHGYSRAYGVKRYARVPF